MQASTEIASLELEEACSEAQHGVASLELEEAPPRLECESGPSNTRTLPTLVHLNSCWKC